MPRFASACHGPVDLDTVFGVYLAHTWRLDVRSELIGFGFVRVGTHVMDVLCLFHGSCGGRVELRSQLVLR